MMLQLRASLAGSRQGPGQEIIGTRRALAWGVAWGFKLLREWGFTRWAGARHDKELHGRCGNLLAVGHDLRARSGAGGSERRVGVSEGRVRYLCPAVY